VLKKLDRILNAKDSTGAKKRKPGIESQQEKEQNEKTADLVLYKVSVPLRILRTLRVQKSLLFSAPGTRFAPHATKAADRPLAQLG